MTSKGQITVPKSVREALGLEPGADVLFRIHEDRAVMARVPDLLDLGGSVPVPARLKGASWSKIRAEAWRKRAARRA